MSDKLILAADELDQQAVLALTSAAGQDVYAIKIHTVYDKEGPSVVQELKDAGAKRVWMDAKLHDIPNTVRSRAKAYADAGVDIITVHAAGGVEMMRAAKEGAPNAEIYAVTVLTSISESTAESIFARPVAETVRLLAHLAKEAGIDGVVCSAKEVGMLSKEPALEGLKFVVPGTRSPGADLLDQKRVATPKEAIDAGATHIVLARQVTQAPDPIKALQAVASEII